MAKVIAKIVQSIFKKMYDVLVHEIAERIIDAIWNWVAPLPEGS